MNAIPNQCPGCGSLNTLSGGLVHGGWHYYCAPCDWGFGHPQTPRDYDAERTGTGQESRAGTER